MKTTIKLFLELQQKVSKLENETEIQKNVSDLEDALKSLKHRKCAILYEDMEKYGLDYEEPKKESHIVMFSSNDLEKEEN